MAQKAIREYDAKMILQRHLGGYEGGKVNYRARAVQVTPRLGLAEQVEDHPWLKRERLVVKPDHLFGKRGKNNLMLYNADLEAAQAWIAERMGKEVVVHRDFSPDGRATDRGIRGVLTHFLVEAAIPHQAGEEYYLAFSGHRRGDYIYFSTAGGVDIEENKNKLITIDVPIGTPVAELDIAGPLAGQLSGEELLRLTDFIRACFSLYVDLHFGFLEFNPIVLVEDQVIPLDTKARLDDTAAFLCGEVWGDITFPAPFGHSPSPEELYIEELDQRSGASMKLTILNPRGRIWTMVAGGGASVIYADTVVDLGYGKELANYGEYSGDPSTEETREYAKTLLDLMTREPVPGGKVFIIGGGIANFTDVAKTFEGIIQALTEYAPKIIEQDIRIYVRRGGPNYVVGLAQIREAARRLGLNMEVHGPEMHMTAIVKKAISTLNGGK